MPTQTEAVKHINAQDFIAPTSIQRRLDRQLPTLSEGLGILEPAEQLTQRFLKSYTPDGISVFVNGEQPKSPRDLKTKTEFDNAVRMVVLDRTQGLFDENGHIKEGKQQEWENVQQIAPELVKILTSRDNYILSVYRNHATAPIAYAIDAARNPRVIEETVFNVGFGGSDDPFTSTRLPSYGEPAARLTDAIHTFYTKRGRQVLTKAQLTQEFDLHKQRLGRELTKEEKKQITENVQNGNADSELLSDEEATQLLAEKGVPQNMPTIRYFFADQAAMVINSTKNRAGIDERTIANMQALYTHITSKYPHLAERVEIVRDAPWSKHPLRAKLQIDYLASIVEEAEQTHPSIKDAVNHLRKRGENHGGENGHKEAHRYAGYHDAIFQDLLSLPFTKYLYQMDKDAKFAEYGSPIVHNPLYNIVLGGRSEKEFDLVRDYVSTHASMEGYMKYVQTRAHEESDPDMEQQLLHLHAKLQRLDRITSHIAQARYSQTPQAADALRPDHPYMTMSFTTKIGRQAPYYATEVDVPTGSDIPSQIEMIEGQIMDIETSGLSKSEITKQRVNLEWVIFDLKALLEDNTR